MQSRRKTIIPNILKQSNEWKSSFLQSWPAEIRSRSPDSAKGMRIRVRPTQKKHDSNAMVPSSVALACTLKVADRTSFACLVAKIMSPRPRELLLPGQHNWASLDGRKAQFQLLRSNPNMPKPGHGHEDPRHLTAKCAVHYAVKHCFDQPGFR